MKRVLLALVILTSAPALARAESRNLDSLTSGWTADQKAQAEKAVESVAASGLSRDAALDRVQEWEAKGADAGRVLSLLQGFGQAAQDGRQALAEAGVTPNAGLVESAAAARLAGVGRTELSRSLRGASSVEDAAGRCLALSTLSTTGFSAAAAADVVGLAAERGYKRAELNLMVASVQRLAREGVAPREALLGEMGSALRRGVRAGELYPAVLQSLGRTARPAPESGYNHPVMRTNH